MSAPPVSLPEAASLPKLKKPRILFTEMLTHSSTNPRTLQLLSVTRVCSTLPRGAPSTSGPEHLGLVPAEVATWIPQATFLGLVAVQSPEPSRGKDDASH